LAIQMGLLIVQRQRASTPRATYKTFRLEAWAKPRLELFHRFD
jgi:hypothetical protein